MSTSTPFSARLSPGTTLTRVEGKAVLFSVRSGESYGLNDMAALMLETLCATDSLRAARRLAQDYAAPEADILNDLAELASSLAELKLVELRR